MFKKAYRFLKLYKFFVIINYLYDDAAYHHILFPLTHPNIPLFLSSSAPRVFNITTHPVPKLNGAVYEVDGCEEGFLVLTNARRLHVLAVDLA